MKPAATRPAFIRTLNVELQAAANPQKAPAQQAYMKSAMPFFGITAPELRRISAGVARRHVFNDAADWLDTVMTLWRRADHREQRYAALNLLAANRYRDWLTTQMLPELEELIVTGAWWDLVDPLAINQFGSLLRSDREQMVPLLTGWATDDNLWKRRTALLAQLKFKTQTDFDWLVLLIEPSLDSKEFFLRKAIGWILREYSKTNPQAVVDYVQTNRMRLSGLSKREALKVLLKNGTVTDVP